MTADFSSGPASCFPLSEDVLLGFENCCDWPQIDLSGRDQNRCLDSAIDEKYDQHQLLQVQEQVPVQQQQPQQQAKLQLSQQWNLNSTEFNHTKRAKDVHVMAEALQLPVRTMHSWSGLQKMKWLKAFLLRYIPNPVPKHLPQRLPELLKAINQLQDQGKLTLDDGVRLVAQFFDDSIGRKLGCELKAWQQVCSILQPEIKLEQPSTGVNGRGSGGDLLWEHVLRLLMEQNPTVQWLALEQGLFCFVDSSGAARSWGNTKSNPNMSFEKMSRSIRQYYKEDGGGIIQKAVGQPKLHYRFSMSHTEVVNFLRRNFRPVCERDPFLRVVVARGGAAAALSPSDFVD